MDVIADLAEPLPAIVTLRCWSSRGRPASTESLVGELRGDVGNFQHNPDHATRMLKRWMR